MREAILALLAERPMHGYQMLQVMDERTGGEWKPSPGSLYPMLQALEDEGLLTSGEREGRRTYELTDAGREQIAGAASQEPPWEGLRAGRGRQPDTLDTALRALHATVEHVEEAAGPQERTATIALIDDLRRSVYLLLADQPGTAPGLAADQSGPPGQSGQAGWAAVDEQVEQRLIGRDSHLDAALAASAAAGLPGIQVTPVQGKLLAVLARAAGASRILEIGTLGGYSSIWLARALPPAGRLISLEIDSHHAEVAQGNLREAGLADRAEVRVGPARQALDDMAAAGEAPFDLVFIDADKESNPAYLRAVLGLTRTGSLIVIDNVVRKGRSLGPEAAGPAAESTRDMLDILADDPRIDATIIQTVGEKGWDGFAIGVVTATPAT